MKNYLILFILLLAWRESKSSPTVEPGPQSDRKATTAADRKEDLESVCTYADPDIANFECILTVNVESFGPFPVPEWTKRLGLACERGKEEETCRLEDASKSVLTSARFRLYPGDWLADVLGWFEGPRPSPLSLGAGLVRCLYADSKTDGVHGSCDHFLVGNDVSSTGGFRCEFHVGNVIVCLFKERHGGISLSGDVTVMLNIDDEVINGSGFLSLTMDSEVPIFKRFRFSYRDDDDSEKSVTKLYLDDFDAVGRNSGTNLLGSEGRIAKEEVAMKKKPREHFSDLDRTLDIQLDLPKYGNLSIVCNVADADDEHKAVKCQGNSSDPNVKTLFHLVYGEGGVSFDGAFLLQMLQIGLPIPLFNGTSVSHCNLSMGLQDPVLECKIKMARRSELDGSLRCVIKKGDGLHFGCNLNLDEYFEMRGNLTRAGNRTDASVSIYGRKPEQSKEVSVRCSTSGESDDDSFKARCKVEIEDFGFRTSPAFRSTKTSEP